MIIKFSSGLELYDWEPIRDGWCRKAVDATYKIDGFGTIDPVPPVKLNGAWVPGTARSVRFYASLLPLNELFELTTRDADLAKQQIDAFLLRMSRLSAFL
jgi:hypothetical protein